jgi:hypothetical protein
MEGERVGTAGRSEYEPVAKKSGRTALLLLAITRLRIGMQSPSKRA